MRVQLRAEGSHEANTIRIVWSIGGVALGFLAAALAATGAGAPAGAAVLTAAGFCAEGAIASDIIATGYDRIASDPPRPDWHRVSIFRPIDLGWPKPHNHLEKVWREFREHEISLAVALHSLVTSIERYPDLTSLQIEQIDASYFKLLQDARRFEPVQLEAVRYNMMAYVRLGDELLRRAPEANLSWLELKEQIGDLTIPSKPDNFDTSLQDVGIRLEQLFSLHRLREIEGFPELQVTIEYSEWLAAERMSEWPEGVRLQDVLPDLPISDDWCVATENMVTHFSSLLKPHRRLREALQGADIS